ncbi:hypothetical protein [Stenotrophomonas phage BUCTxx99]|jgi:hypothetical protein|nr:hypothetical protein [Stenotrophomonas phage BUCTxx99]
MVEILFSLILIVNGHTYVVDYDMTASDCLAAITERYEAGLSPEYMRCEAQPK